MKSVCFDFGSGNMDSSVIKTGSRLESLLPVSMSLSLNPIP
jgi:hypothetical protein